MRRRPLTLLLVLPAVAALSACASTTTGSGTVATGTTGGTTTAASFHAMITRASQSVTSAAFSTKIVVAGETLSGHGVERFSHGRLTALKTSTALPNGLGRLGIVFSRGRFYVKLPISQRAGGKPWAEASPTSSNPELRAMYASFHQLLASASLVQAGEYAAASSSIRKQGTVRVQGARATRYDVTVDVTKLPESFPGIAGLRQAGVSSIPAVIDLDGLNRPVQLSEHVTVLGKAVTNTTTIGHYDAPVKISAPPADEISH